MTVKLRGRNCQFLHMWIKHLKTAVGLDQLFCDVLHRISAVHKIYVQLTDPYDVLSTCVIVMGMFFSVMLSSKVTLDIAIGTIAFALIAYIFTSKLRII